MEDLIGSRRYDEAFKRALPLAQADGIQAQVYIGWMYHTGKGVPRDLDAAERWYRRALKSSSPRVEFYLASVHWERGEKGQMHEWLEKSASKGFAPALYELGRMYRFGYGVPVDKHLSESYYAGAVRLGHVFARRDTARQIMKGRRGFWRIPLGFFMMFGVWATIVRVGWRNPPHDLCLRADGPPVSPRP